MKTIMDSASFNKVITDIIVKHYDMPKSIFNDQSSLFKPKFCFLLYYFFIINIKVGQLVSIISDLLKGDDQYHWIDRRLYD